MSELGREAERRGGRVEILSGGVVSVTLADPFVVTDLARSSASAALALGVLAPRRPIALTMGRAEGARGQLRDELLGTARAMLARRAVRDDGAMATSILLDEMMHDLLGAHYDVRRCEDGPLLVGELRIPDMERRLLGKPTACVGRDRELAALMSFFNECIEGPLGRAVLVTAPAGMGKSRLMRERIRIVRRQHGADVSIWVGPGDPLGVNSAFGILGRALSDACGIQANEPLERQRAKLEARASETVAPSERRRIVEFLGELIGAPCRGDESAPLRAARQDAELMSEQMRRAFLDFVAAETSRRPILIVLEDLHWSDWPTVHHPRDLIKMLNKTHDVVLHGPPGAPSRRARGTLKGWSPPSPFVSEQGPPPPPGGTAGPPSLPDSP